MNNRGDIVGCVNDKYRASFLRLSSIVAEI